jgi:hypothetical protein
MQLSTKRAASKSSQNTNVQIERIVITPDIAAAFLDRNSKNRNVSSLAVNKYAKDMKSGAWQVTGDAIRFAANGDLLDGQHRLKACVVADVPFETFVIYGLPPETQDVMDIGKIRNPSDMFALMGLHNTTGLTAALRILVAERDGVDSPRSNSVSNAMLKRVHQKHSEITRYVPAPGSMPKGISVGQVGFLRYVGSKFLGDTVRTQEFFEVLRFGVPNYDGDPVHMYRERIIRMGDSKLLTMSKNMRWYTLKATFNMFRQRESVSSLRFVRDNCPVVGLDVSKL